jgi:CHAT domain
MSSLGPAAVLADEAYALVQVDPRRARGLAERALAAADAQRDITAKVGALHALSWAQFELGDARSGATARAGVRLARRAHDGRRTGLLLRRSAFAHANAGETRAAQRELDEAIALLQGSDRAESEVFRLAIRRRGRVSDPAANREVLAHAAVALRFLHRNGNAVWEARLLYNRGVFRMDCGDLASAERDLRAAFAIYSEVGANAAAVSTASVIAEVERLQGDIVGSLQTLDSIQARLPADYPMYNVALVRACALADARLLREARTAVESCVAELSEGGFADEARRVRLELARVAILAGECETAAALAAAAARSFAARGEPIQAALARLVRVRAELAAGHVARSSLQSTRADAAVLDRAGWRRDALRAHLLRTRVALALGSLRTARPELQLARPLRRLGSITDRAELAYVSALLALATGDRGDATRALERGLRDLDDYRAALGALELRATASGIGSELAELGLRLAVESRDPRRILDWSERLRGNALRLPLVRPAGDRKLSGLQAELRRITDQIRGADANGKPSPAQFARQRELEGAIRARTLTLRGDATVSRGVGRPDEAAQALGTRVLVEYVSLDGVLSALTLADGELRFHELGPDASATELEWLRFALARLSRGRSDRVQRAAAKTNAEAAAGSLDRLLVEPLLPTLGDAPVVVVPTGALHALPWATLPSLRGRPVEVAPSLSLWLELARRPRTRRRKTAFVAGPRLRNVKAEAREVSSLRAEPTVLAGKEATASATLAALDGAALAHIACHGHFRSDSPLFSSLELADGPLNVYELQRLRHPPELVVLSACDLAVSSLHPGDELLGLATALLGMGTRTIVASVVPVPDAAGRRLMLGFHHNLAAGYRPAAALAAAQKDATVAGFVCLGAG